MPSITSGSGSTPHDVTQLLDGMAHQPTPALVFYGTDGGRVELSGRVFENWVSKTANFFVDDLGLMAGDTVVVDSTAHWRTAVVLAAAWRVGAVVELVDPTPGTSPAEGDGAGLNPGAGASGANSASMSESVSAAQVVVLLDGDAPSGAPESAAAKTEVLRQWGTPEEVLVLAYPALALSLTQERLPDGALDYCAEIRAHGDHWSGGPSAGADHTALRVEGRAWTGHELFEERSEHVRVLSETPVTAVRLEVAHWTHRSIAQLLAIWSTGTTAVLTDREDQDIARIMTSERVGLSWR
ncbi:hypothetical protein GWK18_07005 [Kocuria sp. JC486]|uniref:TIGR03089 family protein n=1 Tax=Kocuria sp. JC486 TaxID=1970736 RepID=UPI001420DE82|nr:TIGR03089 family protein [Kocuria sp. JC486]NHU85341.1 hypothetical protein [Kocuria sp. JC486]